MNELEFLDRQESTATNRVRRALLGDDGVEPPVELLERFAKEHPLAAVGGAAALGGVIGALLGRAPARVLFGLAGVSTKTAWRSLSRSLFG
jgi:hypothetical protein